MHALEAIKLVIVLLIVAVAVYYIFSAYSLYRQSTGTTWQRLLAAGEQSATILLQRAIAVVSAIVGVVVSAIGQLDPSWADTVKQIDPRWYLGVAVVLALITVSARKRTM